MPFSAIFKLRIPSLHVHRRTNIYHTDMNVAFYSRASIFPRSISTFAKLPAGIQDKTEGLWSHMITSCVALWATDERPLANQNVAAAIVKAATIAKVLSGGTEVQTYTIEDGSPISNTSNLARKQRSAKLLKLKKSNADLPYIGRKWFKRRKIMRQRQMSDESLSLSTISTATENTEFEKEDGDDRLLSSTSSLTSLSTTTTTASDSSTWSNLAAASSSEISLPTFVSSSSSVSS